MFLRHILFRTSAKQPSTMASQNENRNSINGNTGEDRAGQNADENRQNSAARDSALDDTTLDQSEGQERAKSGRTDRATGSAEPMRKDDREAAQGRQ